MKREILFRGKRIDKDKWVEGDLIHGVGFKRGKLFILPIVKYIESCDGCDPLDGYEVISETIGQLRYTNTYGRYFDGDVYYHAGQGNKLVSDVCELQEALYHDNGGDIRQILGNIYDNLGLKLEFGE